MVRRPGSLIVPAINRSGCGSLAVILLHPFGSLHTADPASFLLLLSPFVDHLALFFADDPRTNHVLLNHDTGRAPGRRPARDAQPDRPHVERHLIVRLVAPHSFKVEP